MDEQLTCTICSELFVKATTLNCMHTFCQHCINVWNKKRKECPICRASVSSMNRSIVLDNFIESMLKNLPIQFKERRKEILEERQGKHKNKYVIFICLKRHLNNFKCFSNGVQEKNSLNNYHGKK